MGYFRRRLPDGSIEYYYAEQLDAVPHGVYVQDVPVREAAPVPPPQPIGPSQLDLAMDRMQTQLVEARLNALRHQRLVADGKVTTNTPPVKPPQQSAPAPKPTVRVDRVIDPYVR